MRIVFLDVDGTLLDSAHRLRPRSRFAVIRLRDAGVEVVLASARPPGALHPLADRLQLAGPVIAYNGALVKAGLGRDKAVWGSFPLPPAAVAEALALAGQSGLVASVYAGDDWFAPEPDHPWIREEAAITGLTPRAVDGSGAIADRTREAHKILLIGEAHRLDVLEREAEGALDRLGVSATRSKPTYWEWVRAGVSKGTGVALVLKALGISPQEAAAVGDGANDLAMFRQTAVGVAMGNAPVSVRSVATWVTGAADEDGLAEALQRLVPAAFDENGGG